MYEIEEESDVEYKVADEVGTYKAYRDFTTLECWKLARKVKLFFYEKILPQLPKEEKYNLVIKSGMQRLAQQRILQRGMGDFILRNQSNFIESPEVLNLS